MTQGQTLTNDDVAALGDYARIALMEEELDEMCAYLNEAISLLDPILAYDLADVEPTYHPVGDVRNVTREDSAVKGLSLEDALGNARSRSGRFFRVPAILGDGGAA